MAKSKASSNGNGTAVMEKEVPTELVRKVTVRILGVAPYSQSRMVQTERRNKQDHDEFDAETWRERAHQDEEGYMIVPTTSIYLGLIQAAKFRGEKMKGKGNKTYADRFVCGLIPQEDAVRITPEVLVEDVPCEALMVPSDGSPAVFAKGQSKRVKRRFPTIPVGWEITCSFVVLDEAITEEVFLSHLVDVGRMIGIGRWRPSCRGRYGRFKVESVRWEMIEQ